MILAFWDCKISGAMLVLGSVNFQHFKLTGTSNMAHPYVSFADFQDGTTSHGVHCIHFLGASDETKWWTFGRNKLDSKISTIAKGFIYIDI